MTAQLMKANCTTDFSMEKEGNELTLKLMIKGLPDAVIAAMLQKGDELPMPMIAAIMKVIASVITIKEVTKEELGPVGEVTKVAMH